MAELLNTEKKKVRLISEQSFPIWSIVHYLNRLSINYLKLLTIERVCIALADGCLNEDLIVAEESVSILSTAQFSYDEDMSYQVLVNKGENYKEFWNIIKTHHRPIVFRRIEGMFKPLVDIQIDDLIINNLTVSSPPDITITGAGSTLTDLYYAGEREQRGRHAHQNEQIGQAARNLGDLASSQALLNNPNLGEGMQQYLGAMIISLIERQDELNKEMKLRPTRINERA